MKKLLPILLIALNSMFVKPQTIHFFGALGANLRADLPFQYEIRQYNANILSSSFNTIMKCQHRTETANLLKINGIDVNKFPVKNIDTAFLPDGIYTMVNSEEGTAPAFISLLLKVETAPLPDLICNKHELDFLTNL